MLPIVINRGHALTFALWDRSVLSDVKMMAVIVPDKPSFLCWRSSSIFLYNIRSVKKERGPACLATSPQTKVPSKAFRLRCYKSWQEPTTCKARISRPRQCSKLSLIKIEYSRKLILAMRVFEKGFWRPIHLSLDGKSSRRLLKSFRLLNPHPSLIHGDFFSTTPLMIRFPDWRSRYTNHWVSLHCSSLSNGQYRFDHRASSWTYPIGVLFSNNDDPVDT